AGTCAPRLRNRRSPAAWPRSQGTAASGRRFVARSGSSLSKCCGWNCEKVLRTALQVYRLAIRDGPVRRVPVLLKEELVVRLNPGDRLDGGTGDGALIRLVLLAIDEEV